MESLEAKVEAMLRRLKKAGTPTSKADYRVVLAMLLPCSDEALEEIARQSRMMGVGYLQRLCECLITELGAGRAVRDGDGAIRIKQRPNNEELRNIIEG